MGSTSSRNELPNFPGKVNDVGPAQDDAKSARKSNDLGSGFAKQEYASPVSESLSNFSSSTGAVPFFSAVSKLFRSYIRRALSDDSQSGPLPPLPLPPLPLPPIPLPLPVLPPPDNTSNPSLSPTNSTIPCSSPQSNDTAAPTPSTINCTTTTPANLTYPPPSNSTVPPANSTNPPAISTNPPPANSTAGLNPPTSGDNSTNPNPPVSNSTNPSTPVNSTIPPSVGNSTSPSSSPTNSTSPPAGGNSTISNTPPNNSTNPPPANSTSPANSTNQGPPASPGPPIVDLKNSLVALQALKLSISNDPFGALSNWVGPSVCNYTGIICETAAEVSKVTGEMFRDPKALVVSGIDLNGYNLTGKIPQAIILLKRLGLLHLSHNNFGGTLPDLSPLYLLGELDLSSNAFTGRFPPFLLRLPFLRYLDLRFNSFKGPVPRLLFTKSIDVIAVNNNQFTLPTASASSDFLWGSLAASKASMVIMANNPLGGSLSNSIGLMAPSLDELVLSNVNFSGIIPPSIGLLNRTATIDLHDNSLTGPLPSSLKNLTGLVILDISGNNMTQNVSTCPLFSLPNLQNLSIADNFFTGDLPPSSARIRNLDGSGNCLSKRKKQRATKQCQSRLQPQKQDPRRAG